MNIEARKELSALVALGVLFVILLLPALLHARQETRDGIRRDELAAFKQVLERENNDTGSYPLEFNASPHKYVVDRQDEGGALEWRLRAQLENNPRPTAGFDYEAGRNYYYRIVREDGFTYYEVCGGESTCGLAEKPPAE